MEHITFSHYSILESLWKESDMASRRGDAKTQVEQWSKLFEPFVGKDMTLSFDKFSYAGVYIDRIELGKTTGMVNAPEKRISDENKPYTPAVMQIITNAGVLRFVIEDTQVVSIANGVRLITAANEIDLRITL